jgi:hypothetical protein
MKTITTISVSLLALFLGSSHIVFAASWAPHTQSGVITSNDLNEVDTVSQTLSPTTMWAVGAMGTIIKNNAGLLTAVSSPITDNLINQPLKYIT